MKLFCLLAILCGGANYWALAGEHPATPESAELKYEEPKYLTGAIYSPGDKQLLFRFKRVATRSGSTLKVQRDFTYPSGKLAAQERLTYEGDELVSYELDEMQTGASGSAKIRRTPHHPSAGRIEFRLSHWDALQRGEKLKCRYLGLPRRETVGFNFVIGPEFKQDGRDVLIIRMEPSSPFVAALVDPLVFSVEKAPPHHILQYVGRTTPKSQVGRKWCDLDAVTVFDWPSAR